MGSKLFVYIVRYDATMTTVVVSAATSIRVLGLPRGYSRCDARRIYKLKMIARAAATAKALCFMSLQF